MREDKFERDMARLEAARRRSEQRMQHEQERLKQRFDRMQEHLERKFGKASDTQQRIIAAALELLKEDGLANITLRKLADKVGVQAPALYWHFKDKETLVDYMAEAILQKELSDLEPRADDQTWQEWLTDHMVLLRRAMLAYPDGARTVAGAHLYPAVTLAKSMECGLISLSSAGIDLSEARKIITTATTYTFGYVIEEQAAPTAEQMAEFDLDALLEPYPHMARALTDDDRTLKGQDKDFLAGLNYIIAGAS